MRNCNHETFLLVLGLVCGIGKVHELCRWAFKGSPKLCFENRVKFNFHVKSFKAFKGEIIYEQRLRATKSAIPQTEVVIGNNYVLSTNAQL